MSRPADGGSVRLAELVAMLSLGTDLGLGQPMEHVQRQSLIALHLADRVGLDVEDREVVYYGGLLAWVGCHVDAHEQARWLGDDLTAKAAARLVDFKSVRADVGYVLSHVGAGRSLLERARLGVGLLTGGYRAIEEMLENHGAATEELAESLGLGPPVLRCLRETYERWDGRGPLGLRGDAVCVPSRLITLADVVEVHHRVGGVSAATTVARARAGTEFDPELVALFVDEAPTLFEHLDDIVTWETVLAAEPALERVLTDGQLRSALEAIADFTDLKSPYTLGHSRGVAELAAAAASALGLPDGDVELVRRAGLVHDLGRLGVSNAIWDKRGPLGYSERERIRLHPYLTERMLSAAPALAPLAEIAAHHHERLDGSGYPRGLRGDALSLPARILAAADVYQAMSEPRPHRGPVEAEGIVATLRDEVRAGRLDAGAVDAVLGAAGHRVPRRREGPAGLTTREVEVLRLVAQGLSNKEIAARLVITRKTASNHVAHIYAKAGVSNRAQASMFALRHGLLPETTVRPP